MKLDGSGNVVWQKTYGGSSDDTAYSIAPTSDGGYIVAGYTASFGAGSYDAWVLKLDGSGNVVWQKTYGGSRDDWASSIAPTSDGGYVLAGRTGSFGAGNGDAWVFKLDGSGNVVWQKTYGGSSYDYAYSIAPTSDGGYIVAGKTDSLFTGYGDAWVLKLDANGNVGGACSIVGSSTATVATSAASVANTSAVAGSRAVTVTSTSATVSNTAAQVGTQCTPALTPFLDLPFDYSGTAADFAIAAQGNTGGGGRVNSWFDHSFPTYCGSPNGSGYNSYKNCIGPQNITTWRGKQLNNAALYDTKPNVRDGCSLGISCYDGHNGIDFQNRQLNESIFAAAPGVVAEVWNNWRPKNPGPRGGAYGNYVVINHRNGYASLYGHLQSVNSGIVVGTEITDPKSQSIGKMGGTGGFPIHLHFTLFYTQSVNGPWTWNDVVDPYGWSGSGADPWSAPSLYMWKYSLWALQSIGTSGASVTSPSGKVNANVPPGAVNSTLTLQLGDVPQVAQSSAQLRTVGRSFLLQILEWRLSRL